MAEEVEVAAEEVVAEADYKVAAVAVASGYLQLQRQPLPKLIWQTI